ncbi:MAG TPA: TlpA family protein disulfide reductase [Thiotrichales bacterium]|nr:TlpA family protein disulfide reductase [Thiotrichales bacterium]
MKTGNLVTGAVVAVILGVSGYALWQGSFRPPAIPPAGEERSPAAAASKVLGQSAPEFTLADLEGTPHRLSEWQGKVVVVNFWATWCPPCRREIPALIQLQEEWGERGVQVVGIAIDQPQLVEEYSDTMGINYPILVGEAEAVEISRRYGNRFGQLPYTAIVDPRGEIAAIKRGEITLEQAQRIIEPLLP